MDIQVNTLKLYLMEMLFHLVLYRQFTIDPYRTYLNIINLQNEQLKLLIHFDITFATTFLGKPTV